jgi:hypothetical protein
VLRCEVISPIASGRTAKRFKRHADGLWISPPDPVGYRPPPKRTAKPQAEFSMCDSDDQNCLPPAKPTPPRQAGQNFHLALMADSVRPAGQGR